MRAASVFDPAFGPSCPNDRALNKATGANINLALVMVRVLVCMVHPLPRCDGVDGGLPYNSPLPEETIE
jgi:hypothetical protein